MISKISDIYITYRIYRYTDRVIKSSSRSQAICSTCLTCTSQRGHLSIRVNLSDPVITRIRYIYVSVLIYCYSSGGIKSGIGSYAICIITVGKGITSQCGHYPRWTYLPYAVIILICHIYNAIRIYCYSNRQAKLSNRTDTVGVTTIPLSSQCGHYSRSRNFSDRTAVTIRNINISCGIYCCSIRIPKRSSRASTVSTCIITIASEHCYYSRGADLQELLKSSINAIKSTGSIYRQSGGVYGTSA